MKSKTRIDSKLRRKTNQELVDTILHAKKNDKWVKIADLISVPRKKQVALNLDEIDKQVKDGETVLVPGKVLSMGELDKKIKLIALSFSEVAKEKLKKAKIETLSVEEEMKKNPDAKSIHIITGAKNE